jgi:prophage tail gpP-like protein
MANGAIQTPSGRLYVSPPTTTKTDPPITQYTIPARPANSQIPRDQATLIVNGINFQDWESIFVQLRWHDSFSYFRFASVERDTPVGAFYKLQFMPGTPVLVNLGDVNILKGYIETRQVAYDANQHGIELQGKSWTAPIARSSVNTKSGSFDGMTFMQVAQKVVSPYDTKIIPIGNLNSIPFDKLQNQPGEQIWDFLERIARPRGIILGSDSFGNFLAIGDHQMPVLNTQLIEGQNIKKCQCVFHKDHVYDEYKTTAQTAASDDNWGVSASELEGSWAGTGYKGSLLITPSEQPVKNIQEVLDRAKNEALWHEGPQIDLTVSVQGWFRDDTNLWWPGDNVFVYSPMCPMNMMMKIETVTFTQDNNNGTMTQLDLKQPWALKDSAQMNPGDPNGRTPSVPDSSIPNKLPDATKPGEEIPPVD